MKQLTSTRAALTEAIDALHIRPCQYVIFGDTLIDVWQYERGNQGSCSPVAQLRGPTVAITQATGQRSGCTSNILELGAANFALLGGKLYQIDKCSPFHKTSATGQISLDSDTKLPVDRTLVREQIANLDLEIEKLRDKRRHYVEILTS